MRRLHHLGRSPFPLRPFAVRRSPSATLSLQCLCCSTVIVIDPGDFSTLSHILFLQIHPSRRLPPLEMTMNVWIHRDKGGFSERNQKAALPYSCAATFIPNSSFLIPNFFCATSPAGRYPSATFQLYSCFYSFTPAICFRIFSSTAGLQ